MGKVVLLVITLLSTILLLSCAEIEKLTGDLTTSSTAKSPKITKSATLESKWVMKQIELQIAPDEKVEILLKLTEQNKVDGYFYIEDGNISDFKIAGNSLIYSTRQHGTLEPGGVSSARFSFVATQDQGNTYTLTFSNIGDDETRKKETAFLEIIYPVDGSLFIPVVTD